MNSVGIDISKGRSMVAVMRPFGEVVISSCYNIFASEKWQPATSRDISLLKLLE